MYQREDGGVCTDAERERKDCDQSKSGAVAKNPKAETQIPEQVFKEADAASIAAILFGLLEAAEFTAGFAEGFLGREAAGYVFLSFLVEVELQLFAQV